MGVTPWIRKSLISLTKSNSSDPDLPTMSESELDCRSRSRTCSETFSALDLAHSREIDENEEGSPLLKMTINSALRSVSADRHSRSVSPRRASEEEAASREKKKRVSFHHTTAKPSAI